MIVKGFVHKYGDNIDTDVIFPARYLGLSLPEDLAKHCMEDIDPRFSTRVAEGDIIIAGENFGCGSSREHAPLSIKSAGVSCVIAKSFARIFYRNAINIGLPILECPQAVDAVMDADEIRIDFGNGWIDVIRTGEKFSAQSFPKFIGEIFKANGLISYIKTKQL